MNPKDLVDINSLIEKEPPTGDFVDIDSLIEKKNSLGSAGAKAVGGFGSKPSVDESSLSLPSQKFNAAVKIFDEDLHSVFTNDGQPFAIKPEFEESQPIGGIGPVKKSSSQEIMKNEILGGDYRKLQQYYQDRIKRIDEEIQSNQNVTVSGGTGGAGASMSDNARAKELRIYKKNLTSAISDLSNAVVTKDLDPAKKEDIREAGWRKREIFEPVKVARERKYQQKGLYEPDPNIWASGSEPLARYYTERIGMNAFLENAAKEVEKDPTDKNALSKYEALSKKYDSLLNDHPEAKAIMFTKLLSNEIYEGVSGFEKATSYNPLFYVQPAMKKLQEKYKMSDEQMKELSSKINWSQLRDGGSVNKFFNSMFGVFGKSATAIDRLVESGLGGVDKDQFDVMSEKANYDLYDVVANADRQQLKQPQTTTKLNPLSGSLVQEEINPKAGKFNLNFFSVLNTMADVSGQAAGYGLGSKAISLPLKAAGLAEGTANTAATLAFGTMSSFEDNYLASRDILTNDKDRLLYAMIQSAKSAATELIYPDMKYIDNVVGKVAVKEASAFSKIIPKEGIQALTKQTTLDFVKKSMKESAIIAGKEVSEELIDQIGNYTVDAVFNPKSVEGRNLGSELWDTFVQTSIGMLPMSAVGGHTEVRNKSRLQKEALYQAGLMPETFKSSIAQNYANGGLTETEFNNQIKVVNTMQKIAAEIGDKKLSQNQKADYAYNRLMEMKANEEIENTTSESLKSELATAASELVKDQKEILQNPDIERTGFGTPLSPKATDGFEVMTPEQFNGLKVGDPISFENKEGDVISDTVGEIDETGGMVKMKDSGVWRGVSSLDPENVGFRVMQPVTNENVEEVEDQEEITDAELKDNKTQVKDGNGTWRKTFNETSDALRKKDILRSVADVSTDKNELNDIAEAAKGLPEGLQSEINDAVEHKLNSLSNTKPKKASKAQAEIVEAVKANEKFMNVPGNEELINQPDKLLEFIQQQALNLNSDWTPAAFGETKNGIIDTLGEDVVNKALSLMKPKTESEVRKERIKKATADEPNSFEEEILHMLLSNGGNKGGTKFSSDDFKRYTGFGGVKSGQLNTGNLKKVGMDEFRKRIWYLSKDGVKFDQTVHQLAEKYGISQEQEYDFVNKLTDILKDVETKEQAISQLEKLKENIDDQQFQQMVNAMERVTPDEVLTEEEAELVAENNLGDEVMNIIENVEELLSQLTDDQIDEIASSLQAYEDEDGNLDEKKIQSELETFGEIWQSLVAAGIPDNIINSLQQFNEQQYQQIIERQTEGSDEEAGEPGSERVPSFLNPGETVWKDPPGGKVIAEKSAKKIPLKEAKSIQQTWKDEALRIGKEEDRSKEVIISMFDYTGGWSQPFVDAGYTVLMFDIQHPGGVQLIPVFNKEGEVIKEKEVDEGGLNIEEWEEIEKLIKKGKQKVFKIGGNIMLNPIMPISDIRDALEKSGKKIAGVMSATPCTTFAVSGAQHWPKHDKKDFDEVERRYGWWAAKHFDSPNEYNQTLVATTELWIDETKPGFYSMENPVGRIGSLMKLPEPTLTFHPWVYGDPYTKKTQLWGKFNPNLPQAAVEPTEGSKIHAKLGSKNKVERSLTPEGFAYSFFIANVPNNLTKQESTEGNKALPETAENRKIKEEFVNAVNKESIEKFGEPYFPSIDNPNVVVLTSDEVERMEDEKCEANRCETNVYKLVKENPEKYYPVRGYFVNKNNFPVEHWWLYERETGKHLEITPNESEDVPKDYVKGYVGVINKNINDEIVKSDKVFDVDFFKSGQRSEFRNIIKQEQASKTPAPAKTKTSDPETNLKTAQAEYEKAARDLKKAEDQISKKQTTQNSLSFGEAPQSELFGVNRDEAKSILDPLREKVKTTRAAFEKAQADVQNKDLETQPQLFEENAPEQTETEYLQSNIEQAKQNDDQEDLDHWTEELNILNTDPVRYWAAKFESYDLVDEDEDADAVRAEIDKLSTPELIAQKKQEFDNSIFNLLSAPEDSIEEAEAISKASNLLLQNKLLKKERNQLSRQAGENIESFANAKKFGYTIYEEDPANGWYENPAWDKEEKIDYNYKPKTSKGFPNGRLLLNKGLNEKWAGTHGWEIGTSGRGSSNSPSVSTPYNSREEALQAAAMDLRTDLLQQKSSGNKITESDVRNINKILAELEKLNLPGAQTHQIPITSQSAKQHVDIAYGSQVKADAAIDKASNQALSEQKRFTEATRKYSDPVALEKYSVIEPRTFATDFKEKTVENHIGYEVNSYADIADLFSIYRSPFIEKVHYVYVKNGVIVGNQAFTDNQPGRVSLLASRNIESTARAWGANEIYVLHNHPSGNATPSEKDIIATSLYGQQIKDNGVTFKGHLVINGTKFSMISPDGSYTEHEFKNPKQPLFGDRYEIGTDTLIEDMVGVANHLLKSKDYFGVVYMDANNRISGYNVISSKASPEAIGRQITDGIVPNQATNYFVVTDKFNDNILAATLPAGFIAEVSPTDGVRVTPYDVRNEIEMADFHALASKSTIPNVGNIPGAPPGTPPPAPYQIKLDRDGNFVSFLKNAKKFGIEYFAVGGGLDQMVRDLKEKEIGNFNEWKVKAKHITQAFREAVRKDYKRLTPELRQTVDNALKGNQNALASLKENVRNVVNGQDNPKSMRRFIDNLTEALIKAGVIPSEEVILQKINLVTEMAEDAGVEVDKKVMDQLEFELTLARKVKNNIGIYTNRAYLKYRVKNWRDKVSQEKVDAAANYLYNEALLQDKELTEPELKQMIEDLLERKSIDQAMTTSKMEMDLGIMQRLKDIPPPIRDLFGEVKDAEWNFLNTAVKMAGLLERNKFLRDIYKNGEGRLFSPTTEPEKGLTKQINNPLWGDLHGKYTIPELAKALQEWDKGNADRSIGMRILRETTSYAKAAKTTLSVVSEIRNMLGNISLTMFNGNFSPKQYKKGFLAIKDIFSKNTDEQNQEFIEKMNRLRVVGTSLPLHEIRTTINELTNELPELDEWSSSAAYKFVKKVKDKLGEVYGATDDIYKIMTFLTERKRLEKAYKRTGTPKTADELDKEAADISLKIMPTFSKVPKFVKGMAHNVPFVGGFISYPTELLRTTVNSIGLSIKQMKSDNAGIRGIGAQRFVWQLMTGSLPYLTSYAVSLLARSLGVDPDDEEKKAILDILPPFYRNVNTTVIKKDGIYYVWLQNGIDGHSFIREIINGAVRGDDASVKNAGSTFLSPYVQHTLVGDKVTQWIKNKDQYERRIYNDADSEKEKAVKFTKHFGDMVMPQTVNDIAKPIKRFSQDRNAEGYLGVLKIFTGQSVMRINPEKAYQYRIKDLEKEVKEINSKAQSDLAKNPSKENEIARWQEKKLQDIQKEFDKAQKTLEILK